MIRLNLVLGLGVVATGLYLVNVQFESRRLFTALDRSKAESRRLEVDHATLQVERRSQATPLRIERLAKDHLHMRVLTPALTVYPTEEKQ
jgi:cell division protein FtsL